MHDIKAIRETPEAYDQGWAKRGLSAQTPDILELDRELRAAQTELQETQSQRNESSKLIGQAKARKDEALAQQLMGEVETLKAALTYIAAKESVAADRLKAVLAALPNIPGADVPRGADEHGNVEERRWGHARPIVAPKDHVALGEGLGLMDFEAAARTSGARFVFLKGDLARLERALGAFMLDIQTREHGYLEVSPPLLVRDEAAFGTGQLPKFAEDLFRTTDGRWLIPTAEVSLTNMVLGQILDEPDLPLRLTALTPSFRSEAGASGKDTRGMIRQHQFYKVELVSITTPDQSEAEHERMTGCAEAILQRLELPYRTMLLCTGDMGFSARKTYDLEVWMPSQGVYREISSCSNCGDFQARRMDARFRRPGEKGTQYLHTLNGSGLAVGRTLVAVLENYQDEGGRISIPPALQPYMGGQTHIGPA
jgi:seryl-tRNA synthetase